MKLNIIKIRRKGWRILEGILNFHLANVTHDLRLELGRIYGLQGLTNTERGERNREEELGGKECGDGAWKMREGGRESSGRSVVVSRDL